MKTAILSIILKTAFMVCCCAQSPPPLEDQITTLWKQKNYTALQVLIDSKGSETPPDVVALHSAKFFYIFIQPDRAKALAAASKLKTFAEATADAGFISFATAELAQVQGFPAADFKPAATEMLTFYHVQFADKYPNINLSAGLRRFRKM